MAKAESNKANTFPASIVTPSEKLSLNPVREFKNLDEIG
jgi:hypothetical protein